MRGLPFDPTHGRSVTAAEIILSFPRAERSDVKKLNRFAASAEEYGFPAPGSLGYSYHCASARSCRSSDTIRTQSISIPAEHGENHEKV